MKERFAFYEWSTDEVSVNDRRDACRQCGSICCKETMSEELVKLAPQILNDPTLTPDQRLFSSYVTEKEACQIEETTGENRLEFLDPNPPAGLKRKENGDCIFLSQNECEIYELRPDDCRRWPESLMVFPLAGIIVRMPLDVRVCILSQILLERAVILENGGIQYRLPEEEDEYWNFIFSMTDTSPEKKTEETKRAYMANTIYRLYRNLYMPNLRSVVPKGFGFERLARLPDQKAEK